MDPRSVALGQGAPTLALSSSLWHCSERWLTVIVVVGSPQVLVVDEVSMLEAEFFDKMEKVARIVRDSNLPFGGIQVILCGDFLQVRTLLSMRVLLDHLVPSLSTNCFANSPSYLLAHSCLLW
jgi:hypothetical protein